MSDPNQWPPQLNEMAEEQNGETPKKHKEPFDFMGKLLTYIIGFGLCAVLVAFFGRAVLWIIGFR